MLKLIGYNLSAPFLGWIKEGHRLAALGREQPLGDMYQTGVHQVFICMVELKAFESRQLFCFLGLAL